jgi:hypothetical protein
MAIKKKGKYLPGDVEVVAIRNSSNRVRAAKVLTEKAKYNGRGRPKNMLSSIQSDKTFSKLLRYFFVPLVNALELGDEPNEKMTFGQRIGFIFGAEHRDVVMAVAVEEFKMPGQKWVGESFNSLGPSGPLDSRILQGTPMMVRIDERMPGRIDIELCDDRTGTVFTLTFAEYQTIYVKLKEVSGCNERLMPPGTFIVK